MILFVTSRKAANGECRGFQKYYIKAKIVTSDWSDLVNNIAHEHSGIEKIEPDQGVKSS